MTRSIPITFEAAQRAYDNMVPEDVPEPEPCCSNCDKYQQGCERIWVVSYIHPKTGIQVTTDPINECCADTLVWYGNLNDTRIKPADPDEAYCDEHEWDGETE